MTFSPDLKIDIKGEDPQDIQQQLGLSEYMADKIVAWEDRRAGMLP